MNQIVHPSSLGYKKETFRKQIRRQKINQQFASKRKMLFRQTLTHGNHQTIHLNSWEQVKQQLTAFSPDYCAIHMYVNSNRQMALPEDIELLLISLVHRPEFLTNQDSLSLLVTLTFVRNKEGKTIFESGTIKLIVDNLLKWSLVEVEIDGIIEERVHYFETVCWTLFSFLSICENDKQQVFESFRQKRQAFEKSCSQLCYQQIALFALMSTMPSFLPSSEFIRRIIQKSVDSQREKSNFCREIMVPLLDNFMRQKQQNPLRFEVEDDKDLNVLYFEFIYINLHDMRFPKTRIAELINLLTTLINSMNENGLHGMFGTDKAMKLMGLIFYNSQFQIWDVKRASLECIMAMMTNEILVSYLKKRFSASELAYLCYNSLLLPDAEIKHQLVGAIMSLCCLDSKAFIKEFRRYNLHQVIKKIEHQEAKSAGNREQQISLSEYVVCLEEFLRNAEANLTEQQSQQWERQQYHEEKELEI